MMKILLSCKANYRKDDIMRHLLCMHEWVHVDEGRCKLSLEKNSSSPTMLCPIRIFI